MATDLEFLTRKEAADRLTQRGLRTSASTLQKWATTGGGPPYRRYGILAVYRRDDLDEWADTKMGAPRTSTSAA